jgi:hypothetical protein
MPSRKVFFKCTRPFVHEQIRTEAAQEQLGLSKRSIGSYFASKNSTRPGTGLSEDEIKVLLPQILGRQPGDQNFRIEVDQFFVNLNTLVPYDDHGLELEVGLELDNDKPVTYKEEVTGDDGKVKFIYNLPIDVDNYVRYRHGINHPFMAPSSDVASGASSVYMFYTEDPISADKAKLAASEIRDKASLAYAEIKTNEQKIDQVLTILNSKLKLKVGEVVVLSKMSHDKKLLKVRELLERYPKELYDTISDPDIQYKYLVNRLLFFGLLIRAGSSILVQESGEALGSDVTEAAKTLFKDPTKNALAMRLKELYNEKRVQQEV